MLKLTNTEGADTFVRSADVSAIVPHTEGCSCVHLAGGTTLFVQGTPETVWDQVQGKTPAAKAKPKK